MKESNAVANAKTDTKKLNAAVALISLQLMDAQGGLTEEEVSMVTDLCDQLVKTDLYKEDGKHQDKACIQHAISLIEEYLEEEGV